MKHELTYGEKAVGITFNPSNDDAVTGCKAGFAILINQMWAVKAITWKA